jgi:tRNA (guanine37-N1)-methyltransferase
MSLFRFDVLTLFPDLVEAMSHCGLIGKAIDNKLLAIEPYNWRQHAGDRHGTVDDAPFGGGAGMVLKVQPLVEGLAAVRRRASPGTAVVLLSPAGRRFDQETAERWAKGAGLILVCGRYEGFDARIEQHVEEIVSIGDYVLNGGEVAAMAIIEAVGRLRPGVLGNDASVTSESHALETDRLLEPPQYTRPRTFGEQTVPEVLISGDHGKIARWRLEQSRARTRRLRPDLLPAEDRPTDKAPQGE